MVFPNYKNFKNNNNNSIPHPISAENLEMATKLVNYLRSDPGEIDHKTKKAFDYIDSLYLMTKHLSFTEALKIIPKEAIFAFAISRGNTRYIQVSKGKKTKSIFLKNLSFFQDNINDINYAISNNCCTIFFAVKYNKVDIFSVSN